MNLFTGSLINLVIRYPKFMESALLKKIMFIFPHKIAHKYDNKVASRPDYEMPLLEGLNNLNLNSAFDGNVLDICSGTGFATLTAAKLFPKAEITGIDQSPAMVSIATQKAASGQIPNAKFINGDAFDLPFKANSFDFVMVSNAPFYLDELVRVLKQDAICLIAMSFGGSSIANSRRRIEEYLANYNLQVIEIKQVKTGAYIYSQKV